MKHLVVLFFSFLFAGQITAQTNNIWNVRDYGASGLKGQLATVYIQNTIDSCAASGGGRVYFPPGEYLSGSLGLKSSVTLYLESGATLFASQNPADFEVPNWHERYRHPVLIYADGSKNISIEGKGMIHGQARREYRALEGVDGFIKDETEIAFKAGIEMKQFYKLEPFTFLVLLVNCEDVTIRDISLFESSNWTLHTQWCNRVKIDGVYICSSLTEGVNADGIDIDGCSNVTISNSIIETGDDAICLKTTLSKGKTRACENVTVNNCILTSSSTALKIGTESHSDFKNILFNNCVIRNSNRGLSIVIRDGANVSEVKYSNITMELNRKHFNWWGNADPIYLVVMKRDSSSRLGSIKDISFDNISANAQGTSRLEGFPGKPLENIRITNLRIMMNAETKTDKRASSGFWTHDVNGLMMDQCRIDWNEDNPEPLWGSAFVFENILKLRLDNLSCKQAPYSENAAILISDSKDVIIDRCFAEKGCKTFLKISGENTQQIVINDNYHSNALEPYEYSDEVNRNAIWNK